MLTAVHPDGSHGSDGDVEERGDGVGGIDGHKARVKAILAGGGANLDARFSESGLSDSVVLGLEFYKKREC